MKIKFVLSFALLKRIPFNEIKCRQRRALQTGVVTTRCIYDMQHPKNKTSNILNWKRAQYTGERSSRRN